MNANLSAGTLGLILLANLPAFAQTPAPTTPAPAPGPAGLGDWWWVVVLVLVVALAVGYFVRRQKRR